MLDIVFSLDSIITAVGMTDDLPIMVAAVVVAVALMLVAATPIATFIQRNPTVVMLALAFLLVIGMALIADGFGVHVPKGYIYAAMAFSALVETLNLLSRRARRKKAATEGMGKVRCPAENAGSAVRFAPSDHAAASAPRKRSA
jgi:predicted tellurium resistance membrane protein TerC